MSMLDLGAPPLDRVQLANGLGVEAARATTMDACADLMAHSFKQSDPFLIELMIDANVAYSMKTSPTDFYDIYALLSDAERETRARWRAFLETEIAPIPRRSAKAAEESAQVADQ